MKFSEYLKEGKGKEYQKWMDFMLDDIKKGNQSMVDKDKIRGDFVFHSKGQEHFSEKVDDKYKNLFSFLEKHGEEFAPWVSKKLGKKSDHTYFSKSDMLFQFGK